MPFLLITAFLSVTPEEGELGHAFTRQSPLLRVGFASGFGGGPRGASFWLAPETLVFIDLPEVKWVSLRAALPFRLILDNERGVFPTVGIAPEIRLHLGQRFEVGVGLELNLGIPLTRGLAQPFLGPTATLGAVRLGKGLPHELSLSAVVLFPVPRSLDFSEPGAFLFLRHAYVL